MVALPFPSYLQDEESSEGQEGGLGADLGPPGHDGGLWFRYN